MRILHLSAPAVLWASWKWPGTWLSAVTTWRTGVDWTCPPVSLRQPCHLHCTANRCNISIKAFKPSHTSAFYDCIAARFQSLSTLSSKAAIPFLSTYHRERLDLSMLVVDWSWVFYTHSCKLGLCLSSRPLLKKLRLSLFCYSWEMWSNSPGLRF